MCCNNGYRLCFIIIIILHFREFTKGALQEQEEMQRLLYFRWNPDVLQDQCCEKESGFR